MLKTFSLAIFLLRLPPLKIPSIENVLFNSHSIARYILLFLLLIIFLKKTRKKIMRSSRLIDFALFLFTIKSFSIITAVSLSGFFSIYKDVFFGIILLYVALNLIRSKREVIRMIYVLIVSLFANLFFQILIYFRTDFYINFLSHFLYSKYFENFLIHFQRGRYFVDIFDASLVPLLLYFLKITKNFFRKGIFLAAMIFILFFSLVSGFRIHFMVFFFSIIFYFFLLKKRKEVFFLSFLLIFIVFVLSTNLVDTSLTTLNRLNLADESSTESIFSRIDFWNKALMMGFSNYFLGVGLGNYYDYYYPKNIFLLSLFNPKNRLLEVTAFHPHNIFFGYLAELGILGLSGLFLLLVYFVIIDFIKNKERNSLLRKTLITCFWSLFIFSLVMPDNIIQYTTLFWILRVLIERVEIS